MPLLHAHMRKVHPNCVDYEYGQRQTCFARSQLIQRRRSSRAHEKKMQKTTEVDMLNVYA